MKALPWLLIMLSCLTACGDSLPNKTTVQIPLPATDASLAGTLIYPEGPGPFPVAIVNHGTSHATNRAKFEYWLKPELINTLLDRGFAVLVPIRRGFGATDGEYRAGVAACLEQAPDYYQAGMNAGEDIIAAVEYARLLPQVDANQVILLGHSAGGFASLAAASKLGQKIAAVANFAGGRGGNFDTWGEPCHSQTMAEAIGRYSQSIDVPTFWYYANNDRFFGPQAARLWFNAFLQAGGQGHLIIGPGFKKNGHGIFIDKTGIPIWIDQFDQFWQKVKSNS